MIHQLYKLTLCIYLQQLPAPPPSVQYPLDGGSMLHVDGKVREHACEVMFEQDNEQQSIATLILDAIVQVTYSCIF